MPDPELGAFDALAAHARLADLVAITRAIATTAAEGRMSPWTGALHRGVCPAVARREEAKLTQEDSVTPFGNALGVLERGPEDDAERSLACALWAHAIAEAPPMRGGKKKTASRPTSSGLRDAHALRRAMPLLDRALGEAATDLWDAITDRIRRVDQASYPTLGRGEALVACAALAESASPTARKLAEKLATELKDQAMGRILAARAAPPEETIEGELGVTPRGPVVTTLLAVTGALFVIHAVLLLAHVALAFKRPTELTISPSGVHVHTRTELLGRVIRERDQVILRSALQRATRDVRFPHLAFYAGLLAPALGSYLGVATLIDGARAASPSLLLTGLLVVAAGILLEMLLGSVQPGMAGRCRVVLQPARGTVCVTDVDPKRRERGAGAAREAVGFGAHDARDEPSSPAPPTLTDALSDHDVELPARRPELEAHVGDLLFGSAGANVDRALGVRAIDLLARRPVERTKLEPRTVPLPACGHLKTSPRGHRLRPSEDLAVLERRRAGAH